jgi:hypothetical protein
VSVCVCVCVCESVCECVCVCVFVCVLLAANAVGHSSELPAQGEIVTNSWLSPQRHKIVRVKNGLHLSLLTRRNERRAGGEGRVHKTCVLMELSSLYCLGGKVICCLVLQFSVTRCRESVMKF